VCLSNGHPVQICICDRQTDGQTDGKTDIGQRLMLLLVRRGQDVDNGKMSLTACDFIINVVIGCGRHMMHKPDPDMEVVGSGRVGHLIRCS